MSAAQHGDFSIEALFAALDAARQSRGISWQQVAREVNAQLERVPARPLSTSTIVGMRKRRAVEGDGVLQMLRWLGRTPESFTPGLESIGDDSLPDVAPQQILRFDARAIHVALEAQRIERRLTWAQVAHEIGGINAAGLARLAQGGRVGFPGVMRIVGWLGRPAASFTRACDR